MPDAPATDSTLTTDPSAVSTKAESDAVTDRAEALAARVRALDAEVRAMEAEALALSAEAEAKDGAADGRPADDPAEPSTARGAPLGMDSQPASALAGSPAAVASDPAGVSGDGLQRREFVRRVTSDAVVMAGKFYSISRVITRSASAAGQAVIADLESIRRDQDPEGEPAPDATAPNSAAAPAEPTDAPPAPEAPFVVQAAAAPAPSTEPVPPVAPPAPVPLNLTPEQEALLDRVRIATLGVNRAGLSPHLTPAQFHWDGLVIRIPSLGWASRTTNVRREPHATLFVEDPETGEFGAISGMTSIVERRSSVREQNDALLQRYYPDVDAEELWTKLLAEDPDRVLLVLQPTQTIWGRRA